MALNLNGLTGLLSLNPLNQTQNALAQSLEKLASGKQINSAADNAAGLAIANRFLAQINGLNTASRNASDGISYTQTAESALGQTTDALQRIRSLSVQAANGTLSRSDRQAIQQEISQLKDEINGIAQNTRFNGKAILSGTSAPSSFQVGPNAGDRVTVNGFNATTLGLGGPPGSVQSTGSRAQLGSADSGTQGIQEGNADTAAINNLTVSTNGVATGDQVNIAATAYGGAITTVQNTAELTDTGNVNYGAGLAKSVAERINAIRQSGAAGLTDVYATAQTNFSGSQVTAADYSGTVTTTTRTNVGTGSLNNGDLQINGVDIGPVTFNQNDAGGNLINAINAKRDTTGVSAAVNSQGQLQLTASDGRDIVLSTRSAEVNNSLFGGGDNRFSAGFNNLRITGQVTVTANDSINFSGTDKAQTGLNTLQQDNVQAAGTVANINVNSAANAQQSIQSVDAALGQINSFRAALGALQNRFESSIRNLASAAQSQTAAVSRIQDTDYASQIAQLSKQRVKEQAGIALQAQANALAQQVLALLT